MPLSPICVAIRHRCRLWIEGFATEPLPWLRCMPYARKEKNGHVWVRLWVNLTRFLISWGKKKKEIFFHLKREGNMKNKKRWQKRGNKRKFYLFPFLYYLIIMKFG